MPQVWQLRDIIAGRRALLMVLCEVLQGRRHEWEVPVVEAALRQFEFGSMVSPALVINRLLRAQGITVRKTIDMLIGTFCIEFSHTLLHGAATSMPWSGTLAFKRFAAS